MTNSCPRWASHPVPYAYEADTLPFSKRDLISTLGLKLYRVFVCFYLYRVVNIEVFCPVNCINLTFVSC